MKNWEINNRENAEGAHDSALMVLNLSIGMLFSFFSTVLQTFQLTFTIKVKAIQTCMYHK